MRQFVTARQIFSLHYVDKVSLIVNLISLSVFFSCFLLLALNAHKGLDITDRSFYLLWAKQPGNVSGSVTHFGFMTRLLYNLVDKNIELFRLAGVMILSGMGLGLAMAIRRYWQAKALNVHLPFFSLAVILLCGSLFYYYRWLHVPSYNWLALVAVLLTVIGLLLISACPKDKRMCGVAFVLTAAGGALTFIAKPTTAMLLAAMALSSILVHCPNRRGMTFATLSAALAAVLVGIFAWWNFGSIASYLDNLSFGRELSTVLGAGHTLSATVWRSANSLFTFGQEWINHPLVKACLILSLVIAVTAFFGGSNSFIRTGLAGVLLMSLIVFLQLGYKYYQGEPHLHVGSVLLVILSMLIAPSAAVLTVVFQRPSFCDGTRHCINCLFLTVFFTIAAFAGAFGTNNDFVRQTSQHAIFLAAGVFIALNLLTSGNTRRYTCAILGLLVSFLLLITLLRAYEHPYRLPRGIQEQNIQVTVYRDQTLEVDSMTASYIRQLRQAALRAGWQPGTPLIDMTGGSPGALLILEARIPGVPWLLGNYPGSDEFATKVLSSVTDTVLDEAWILTAPQGKRRLGANVLLENGISFPHTYTRVGSFKTGHRGEKQFLWKPRI